MLIVHRMNKNKYRVEVKDDAHEVWRLLTLHSTQRSAEESRRSAWKRGLDAQVVCITAKGEREVML